MLHILDFSLLVHKNNSYIDATAVLKVGLNRKCPFVFGVFRNPAPVHVNCETPTERNSLSQPRTPIPPLVGPAGSHTTLQPQACVTHTHGAHDDFVEIRGKTTCTRLQFVEVRRWS